MRGFFCIEPLESRRLFAVGELDPTFGDGGGVTLQHDVALSAAMSRLPDGRLLVATGTDIQMPGDGIVTLSMLLPDGSPDPSFGGRDGAPAGVVRVFTARNGFYVAEMIVADDGKIVLAGHANNDIALARLNPDGSLDASFGGAARGWPLGTPGVVIVNLADFGERGRDVAVGPDGRIAVVAATDLARWVFMFNPDGSADATFADGGRLRLTGARPNAVAFDGGGDVIVGTDGGLWRIDRAGSVVWSRLTPVPVRDLAVTARGILTAGDRDGDIAAQLLSLDQGFPVAGFGAGDDGIATVSTTEHVSDFYYSVNQNAAHLAVLPDGRFYVLADLQLNHVDSSQYQQYHVARFSAEGVADPAFKSPFESTVVLGRESLWVWEEADLALVGGDAFVERVVRVDDTMRARVVRIDTGDAAFGRATLNRRGTLQVHGDGGDDEIAVRWRTRDNRIVVDVNGLTVRSFPPAQVKRIQVWGYDGNDRVTIGPGVLRLLYIDAGGGDDSVTGGDGNEHIVGGAGNDYLVGGPGNDVLEGNAGNDYLLGSSGRDVLFGNGGRDTLNGAGGHDQLFGGPGSADRILGGAGEDVAARDELDTYDAVEVLLS